jgi:putative ABC transport system permease protein
MGILKEIQYSVRTFARTPLLAAAILLSLALGIGANTAVFSLVDALMFRALPVRDPSTLLQVLHSGDGGSFDSSTYGLYAHLKQHAKTVAGLLQVNATTLKVVIDGHADVVPGQQVTGDYFNVLGVEPLFGTVIQPTDERGSARNHVAVLSHGYWVRRFGSRPDVLGRMITIDQIPHTIVGVTRPEFFGLQAGRRVDVTVPIDGTDDRDFWKSRALLVRVSPDASRSAVVADLNTLFVQYLAASQRLSDRARAHSFKRLDLADVSSGLSEFRDRYGKPVTTLLAIVAVLLLLACANLASLFLARAAVRQRDLAVCLALGAGRAHVVRQLLSDTLLISIVGGALGVLVAWWGVDLLIGFLPDVAPGDLRIRPDTNMLVFTLTASTVTGLAIGIAPVWLAGKVDFRQMIGGGHTAALGAGAFKALIVVQVALSTILVVAATLFTATLSSLKSQPLGFVADGVLLLTLDASGTGFEHERLARLQRQILEKLHGLPGVTHATFTTIPPLSSNEDGKPFSIPGVTLPSPEDGVMQVNTVGPEFFETFGVRILNGRGIDASDGSSTPQVAVVSESVARHYFPGVNPVGRRIDVGRGRTGGQIEIVGVAADARYKDVRTPTPRMIYVSAFQRSPEEQVVFALRAAGNLGGLARSAQRELLSLAPAIPTTDVKTLVRQRDERLVNERLLAFLSLCFGAFALVLASIGVYGTLAYSVTQRAPELGLRIALGASRAQLLLLIAREILTLLVVAILLGVTAAFVTSSVLSSLLFGVRPTEPWVYSATVAVLISVGVLAAFVPTFRATRIEPVETLRWQ